MPATALPARERQRLQTRASILRAGLDEIAKQGLLGARIEHIARSAGVTRPTVYAHFPRKEDFLLALEAEAREEAVSSMTKQVGKATGAEVVHRLADAVYDLTEKVHPVLRREALAIAIREPEEMDWTGDPLFEFLTQRLAEAQARGELGRACTAEELARLLVPAFLGFLVFENVPLAARREAAHRMLDLVMRGAGAASGLRSVHARG